MLPMTSATAIQKPISRDDEAGMDMERVRPMLTRSLGRSAEL